MCLHVQQIVGGYQKSAHYKNSKHVYIGLYYYNNIILSSPFLTSNMKRISTQDMHIELERKERKKMYNVDRHTRVVNVPQTILLLY